MRYFLMGFCVLAFLVWVVFTPDPSQTSFNARPGWLGSLDKVSGISRQEKIQKTQMRQVFDLVGQQHASLVLRTSDNLVFQREHSPAGTALSPSDLYAHSRDIADDVRRKQEFLKQQQLDRMRDQSQQIRGR